MMQKNTRLSPYAIMKRSNKCNSYSKNQFRQNPLWTTDLEKLPMKFGIQNFLGVYPANHHPYINASNHIVTTWIWNTDTSSKDGLYRITIFHKRYANRNVYQIMDLLALPLSSYKDILEYTSAMQHKQVSIETLLTNCMQSMTTFTCG